MRFSALRLRAGRARALSALATVVSVAGVLVWGADQEFPASHVRLRAGTAWLASAQTGQVTLVDGASAEVAARVRVAAPGSPLHVVQQGNAAYVLNQASGALVRVDGATHHVSRAVTPIPSARDTLTIAPSPHAVYAVDTSSGLLAAADLKTLAPRGRPERLVATDGLAIDGRGQPWAAAQRTGELVWLSDGQRQTRAAPGALRLTMTKGQPAVVNVTRGTAELLDSATGAMVRVARPAIRRGDPVAVSGSPDRSRVLLSAGRGFIQCTFDTGVCSRPLTIGSPGSDLGNPVEVDNHAVVPNYATGQATIIDLTTMRVTQRQLFGRGVRFELFAQDGFIFFNDPNSNRAGVLDLSGNVRFITKYDPANFNSREPPLPNPVSQAGQPAHPDQGPTGTGPGHKDAKPGPRFLDPRTGNPGPSDSAGLPVPPAPGLSIVVAPRGRGLVGEEFELALVSRLNARIAHANWRFGDGTVAAGTTVRHRWHSPGTFVVSASATLVNGVRAPIATITMIMDPAGTPPRIDQLNIHRPRPVISETVHFSADVTGSQPEKWHWTISDPSQPGSDVIATTPEFQHAFIAAGTYTVTLTVTVPNHASTSSKDLIVALGNVRAWGASSDGQLLVPPQAGSGVVAVAAGAAHILALKAGGSVIGWGDDAEGQSTPPPQAASGVTAIAAESGHSVALKADGSVICWGHDSDEMFAVPPEARSGVSAIATGTSHILALTADGSVIGWGASRFGQLTIPPQAASGVIAIAAGDWHSVALKADGSVIEWGGVFGREVPVEARSEVVAIAASSHSSLALKADGSVVSWGGDPVGETPVPPEAQSGVAVIAAGDRHALALKADGSVIGWGEDRFGEATVPPQARSGVTAISGGRGFSVVA